MSFRKKELERDRRHTRSERLITNNLEKSDDGPYYVDEIWHLVRVRVGADMAVEVDYGDLRDHIDRIKYQLRARLRELAHDLEKEFDACPGNCEEEQEPVCKHIDRDSMSVDERDK